MGWKSSIVLAAAPALAFSGLVLVGIPQLVVLGVDPLVAWLTLGAVFFTSLLLVTAFAVESERQNGVALAARLRFLPLSRRDVGWLAAGLGMIGLATCSVIGGRVLVGLPAVAHPPFLASAGSTIGDLFLIAPLWFAFVLLNVSAEEAWWRGYMQPRQELRFGRLTWFLQGLLHTLFHVSFGLDVLLTLVPTAFGLPWLAQKTRSTTVAATAHLVINALGVLAVILTTGPSQ